MLLGAHLGDDQVISFGGYRLDETSGLRASMRLGAHLGEVQVISFGDYHLGETFWHWF